MKPPKIFRSLKAALATPLDVRVLALSIKKRRAPLTELAELPALETVALNDPDPRFDLEGTVEAAALCAKLRNFGLFDGTVAALPRNVEKLRGVERVDVWNSGLTAWPDALSAMPSLREFMVHRHSLSEVPDAVGDLTQLRHFALFRGAITRVSPRVAECRELVTLHLAENHIRALPDALAEHPRLAFVHLQGNPELDALPPWFSELPALSRVEIGSTLGRALRESLREKNRSTSVQLYQDQAPYEPIFEA